MPDSLRNGRQRPPEQVIPCPVPTCHAKAGTACRSPRGRLRADSHASRYDAWLVQQHRPAA